MPFEESIPIVAPLMFKIGQPVVDRDGQKVGKVQARFSHYILVESGRLFGKAYYIPHTAIANIKDTTLQLSLSADDLKHKGFKNVPDDLYSESTEPFVPDISGVAKFARGPLSPAETGHYNYGKHSPGINTDASGSYHRDEVTPKPHEFVSETVFTTEVPIEPRTVGSD